MGKPERVPRGAGCLPCVVDEDDEQWLDGRDGSECQTDMWDDFYLDDLGCSPWPPAAVGRSVRGVHRQPDSHSKRSSEVGTIKARG